VRRPLFRWRHYPRQNFARCSWKEPNWDYLVFVNVLRDASDLRVGGLDNEILRESADESQRSIIFRREEIVLRSRRGSITRKRN
jgi:hypothetical protein